MKAKKAEISPKYLTIIQERSCFSPTELAEMAGLHRSGFEHKKNGRQTMAADDFLRLLRNLKGKMPKKEYDDLIKELFIA